MGTLVDTPEIESTWNAILHEGRLTQIPVVSPEEPLATFDGEDRDVLVQGDLAFVHLVRSDRSVLIHGSIRGSTQQSIRVEAKGDVIVTGSAHHAQLAGASSSAAASVTAS